MTDETTRITQQTYDAIAEAFMARTQDPERGRPWLDRFAARLPAGDLVADLGAGPGRDGAELRARGLRAVGLDLSLGMLRAGVERYGGDRVRADLRLLPIASGVLGGAWANASLLHLEHDDVVRTLREIHRTLRSGGVLHVLLKEGRGSGFERERYGRPRWFRFWGADELDRALEASGFEIVESAEEDHPAQRWLVRHARALGQAGR